MKIGDYKIHSIQAGLFKLDGGAMFGVVPKVLWNRTNPSDDSNRIEMCTRVMLLDNGKRKILVDTGIGYKMSKKLNEIYAIDYSAYTLEGELAKLGIKPADITDVILTHLHFDHAGGATKHDEIRKLVSAFQNAKYYVQEKHLDWALNPSDRDRASFFPDTFEPLLNEKRLYTVNDEFRFDEFITLLPLNGHTRFMQMVKVADENSGIYYLADLIPMASHVPLPYIMGYDLFPLITLEEKRKYLNEICEKNYTVFFEHDPYVEAGKVGFESNAYFIREKFSI
ncbi:MAG: MBL fold metallo-hydrolase [Ignavibacteria bacterium]|nr:MBL fold metallo-hydrolase [Ignavibacteria bacterium]